MTSRRLLVHRSTPSLAGALVTQMRAGVLAVIAALLATVMAASISSPVRANGGPVTGVDGTPMRLQFLIEGDRCTTPVLLGSSSLDGEPEPRVRVKWPDGHVNDVTTPRFLTRDLADCVNNQGLQVVEIWPLYADAGGSDTGPWLPLYGADVEGDNGSWPLLSLGETAAEDDSDVARLTRVLQWGELGTTSLRNAFNRHHALIDVPDTLPPGVTDTSYMFRYATAFDDAGIAAWDMTTVTATRSMFEDATSFDQPLAGWERTGSTLADVVDMDNMFEGATAFNQPIGNWDVSSVTLFSDMFKDATSFNQDISTWDVSSAVDMNDMFEDATSFNQPLAGWERTGSTLANVTRLDGMFHGATAFDQDISGWNVSSVTNMSEMFKEATAFDRDISVWNVVSVTDMSEMFRDATAFNRPIGSWNVSSVDDMSQMFRSATSFSQPLAGWERDGSTLSGVTRMDLMFDGATSFNQDISDWDVSNVTDMEDMFRGATSFDRSLGAWTLNAAVDLGGMLDDSGMSSSCYDATLIGWGALDPAVSSRTLGATGREYSPDSAAARAVLVDDRGWTITGDTTVDVATGRCADDDLGGGTDPVSGRTVNMSLDCTPLNPTVGTTVTCSVTGGDADINVLWRAMAGGEPIAGSGVRLAGDGTGNFSFVVPRSTLGLALTVELVEWMRPLALGTVGGPVPAGVPAGAGQPLDGALPFGLAAALLGLVVGSQRLGRRRMLQQR
jgi:surface protein